MPHSDDLLEWTDEIPSLYDLNGRGGKPGYHYLYCDSSHEMEAQRGGWKRIGPVLSLTGPKGTCTFVVMLMGDPAPSLVPESATAPVMVSQYLMESTGLDEPPLATPTKPVAHVEPKAPPTKRVEPAMTVDAVG